VIFLTFKHGDLQFDILIAPTGNVDGLTGIPQRDKVIQVGIKGPDGYKAASTMIADEYFTNYDRTKYWPIKLPKTSRWKGLKS